MSININSVKLTGVVTFEPEERFTPDGKPIFNFSMAFNKDQFVKVSCFDKAAEIASQSVKKGSRVYVEGQLYYQSWKDKSGNNRNMISIRAFKVQSFDAVKYTPEKNKPESNKSEGFSYSEPPEDAPF